MWRRVFAAFCGTITLAGTGCAPGFLWSHKQAEITAVSLDECGGGHCGKEGGIPFYLPKPLLIVSKNFRNVEAATVGLTDGAPIPNGYDDQSKYADLNARTNFNGLNGAYGTPGTDVAGAATNSGAASSSKPTLHSGGVPVTPGKAPSDGLTPETFYTYQIIYVPDMTRRYGLRIKGGPGEMRAALNLVNGWQFTGTGPLYLKDSATAQNILASGISARLGGQAAADVVNASANLAKAFPAVGGGGTQAGAIPSDDKNLVKMSEALGTMARELTPVTLTNFAEIHVYEPHLTPDGQMCWTEIVNLNFNRDFLGTKAVVREYKAAEAKPVTPPVAVVPGAVQAGVIGGHSDEVVNRALSSVFGALPPGAVAVPPGGSLQSGAIAGVPTGGVNQIQVDCGSGKCGGGSKEFNLLKLGGGWFGRSPKPKIETRTVTQTPVEGAVVTLPASDTADPTKKPTTGGGIQAGAIPASPGVPIFNNQPVFNNAPVAAPAPKSEAPAGAIK